MREDADQLAEIFSRLAKHGETFWRRARMKNSWRRLRKSRAAERRELARAIVLKHDPEEVWERHDRGGFGGHERHLCCRGGLVTAELMGNAVEHFYDVGVAGIHRLLANREALTKARVVIVCAGMEGALPSVVGGLVGVPVIAVPTSVGYGASFRGLTALLGMLNSCASNVSVVNMIWFRSRIRRVAHQPIMKIRGAAGTAPHDDTA